MQSSTQSPPTPPNLNRYLLIVSAYHAAITQQLVQGARNCLRYHNILPEQLKEIAVPGAFEIPLAAKWAATSGKYAGILALGCVIKGETLHDTYISTYAINAIGKISMHTGIPISLGILTTYTVDQANERADLTKQNKGHEAAEALVKMLTIKQNI